MEKELSIRLIKPHYKKYRILTTLKRHNKHIVVYNPNIDAENRAYGRIHSLLWHMHDNKFIIYERDRDVMNGNMLAKITIGGIEHLHQVRVGFIINICIIIAAFGGIASIISGIAAIIGLYKP